MSGNKKKPTEVWCTCPLMCQTWDPITQSYRPGERVSPSTRDNHMKDWKKQQRRNANIAQPSQAAVQASNQPWQQNLLLATDPVSDTDIREELRRLAVVPLVHPQQPLVFQRPPIDSRPFIVDIQSDLLKPNCSEFSLENVPANQQFLRAENRVSELHHLIQSLWNTDKITDGDQLLNDLSVIMGRITREKHAQWNEQLVPMSTSRYVNTDIFFYRGSPRTKVYRAVVLSALVLQHIYAAPRRAVATQLAAIRSVLSAVNIREADLGIPLPRDPRTTTIYYSLHPITQKYIACPKCHCLYPWYGEDMEDSNVPQRCSHQSIPVSNGDGSVCDTDLWKSKRLMGSLVHSVPVKIYTHQPIKYWLGRLLSRPGIEDHIDKARESEPPINGVVKDIWDSPCLRNLEDHDKNPFLPGPLDEGRLIFSLAVDSFNPNHVKAAHAVISDTGIWLVLLNLPQHLRYLHENMYPAGVIPGPHKPSLEEINHYLDLVVDDLIELYHPGVRFSRTFKYAMGRVYKAMLIPLICDMLAARQVIGQSAAPTAHNFCTVCDIDKDDINIVDSSLWPPKDVDHIRKYAAMWRDATNEKAREQITDAMGIRWSSLLRLSYWDPVRYTVIDAMHTLDLGLFQNHCRTLFALNVDAPGGDGTCSVSTVARTVTSFTRNQIASYKRCLKLVVKNQAGLQEELLKLDRKVLYRFCVDNNITCGGQDIVIGTKWVLVNSIVMWRGRNQYRTPELPDGMEKPADSLLPNADDSDRESTPGVDVAKNLLPAIRLLLDPLPKHIEKLKTAATKKIYVAICSLLGVSYPDIDLKKRSAKQQLQDLLLERLKEDEDLRNRLCTFLPPDPTTSVNRVVLGEQLMKMVWADMQKTITPTWVATAPPNWGTAERGKLSAAQWRVVCTIHLPITLIRVWHKEEGRKRVLLDHFMDLVCAVRIANMKTTTAEQIEAYNKHIFRYVSNIREIYPDQTLKPTHHLALHIGDFLKSMGPTHSHNSPFFERYINFFHHRNTNSHPVESETTLLNSASINANLRGLLADDQEIQPLVCHMVDTMDKIDKEDIRGFRLASILNPNAPAETTNLRGTPLDLSNAQKQLWSVHLAASAHPDRDVVPTKPVLSYRQIALQGVRYSTTAHIVRDSTIMFSEHCSTQDLSSVSEYSTLKAAYIDMIFRPLDVGETQSSNDYYLLIREMVPAQSTTVADPFAAYGFAGGFLCRNDHEILRVISLNQVKAHAAITPVSMEGFGDVYHVLCLDRLMNVFTTFDYDIESASAP